MPDGEPEIRLKNDGWFFDYNGKTAGPFQHSAEVEVVKVAEHLGCEPKELIALCFRIDKFKAKYPTSTGEAEGLKEADFTWRRMERLNPAFDVLQTGNPEPQLCITIPQSVRVPRKRGEGFEEKVLSVLVFSPCRKAYVINPETFEKLSIYNYVSPALPDERWSMDSFQAWKYGQYDQPDKTAVYTRLRKTFSYFLDCVESGMYWYIPLWIMATYFCQLFATFPRLALTGTKESGKGKVLKVIYCTAFNADWTMNTSGPGLFRTAESLKATLLLDEAEQLGDPERKQELRSLINSSYEKGPCAKRINKQTGMPEKFDTFVPIALGAIQGFEGVLESRATVFTMLRTASEKANREVDLNATMWQKIRDSLYLLLMDHWKEVKNIYDEMKEAPSWIDEKSKKSIQLKGRDWQLWRPMFALVKWLDDPELFDNILRLARRKSAYRRQKDQFDADEILLLKTLKEHVVGEDWWLLTDLKGYMEEGYGEEVPAYFKGEYVRKLLLRLNWQTWTKRGNKWRCKITPEEVDDRCFRYGILKEEPEEKGEQ